MEDFYKSKYYIPDFFLDLKVLNGLLNSKSKNNKHF